MRIDPRTVLLVLTLILAVFGLAHLLFYLVRRRDHWFAYWSAANFAGMAAAWLFALRGGIPALLSIPTANTLAVLAWGGGWNGCLGFVGRRLRLADLGLLAVTVFLLLAIPSPISAHLSNRVVVLSAAMDLLVLATGWLTLGAARRQQLAGAWLATILAAVCFVFIAWRGYWCAQTLRSTKLMAFRSPLGLMLLPSVIAALGLNLSLIVMAAERAQHVLHDAANRDELTQVLNRRGFQTILWRMLRPENSAGQGALLLVDLDNLKIVNDTLGHAAGDRLLRCFARTVVSALRTSDAVGRLGGDEFAIALAGVRPGQIDAITQRLRRDYAAAAALIGHHPPPTLSMGVAFIEPKDRAIDEIMARADQALYIAKAARASRLIALPQ